MPKNKKYQSDWWYVSVDNGIVALHTPHGKILVDYTEKIGDGMWDDLQTMVMGADLLEAAKFALSVIKSNCPVETSEFLAIEKLEAAIAKAAPTVKS